MAQVKEEKEEEVYKKWLQGNKDNAPDEEIKDQMKPLRDFWTNPNIDEEDKFLRDYILNKKQAICNMYGRCRYSTALLT